MKKKTQFAAALVALLPLLFACNKNDDTDTRFEDPRFIQYAGQLIPASSLATTPDQDAIRTDNVPETVLHSIELTESGLYAVGTLNQGELSYRMGEYSISGDVYTLNGYGSVQFDNSRAGEVEIVVKQDGKEAETMPATFSRATGTDQLYRGWTIDKTRVTVKGWTTASADFRGCNLYEIAQFIRNNGHDAPDDIAAGLELRSISFTGTEKMLFAYSDGTGDASEFKYNGSSFTYRWDDEKMGFTFLPKQATVQYMDGKCILSISSDIQDSTTSVSVTFALSPML